jgi:hypothetical protein
LPDVERTGTNGEESGIVNDLTNRPKPSACGRGFRFCPLNSRQEATRNHPVPPSSLAGFSAIVSATRPIGPGIVAGVTVKGNPAVRTSKCLVEVFRINLMQKGLPAFWTSDLGFLKHEIFPPSTMSCEPRPPDSGCQTRQVFSAHPISRQMDRVLFKCF